MAKYILTKDFSPINECCGILQNLSGDSNIEITNDPKEQGIILKPFQKTYIAQKVYARKLTGGGTGAAVVLPFKEQKITTEISESDTDETSATEDTDIAVNANPHHKHKPRPNPYDVFDNEFFNDKIQRRHPSPIPVPPPFFPFPPDFDPNQPLSVKEFGTHYLVGISKESLKGQKKFMIQFDN